jgi:hypothetical protein
MQYELPLVKLRGRTLRTSFAIEFDFALVVSSCRPSKGRSE